MTNKEKSPLLTIVIPCFNEELNLPELVNRCELVALEYPIKFVLVENGSLDNSREVLGLLIKNNSHIESVFLTNNMGYGGGIIEGLKIARTTWIGWTHADLQTDLFDIGKPFKNEYFGKDGQIYLKGLRRGRGIFDQIFTIGMSLFESVYFKKFLWDINAQPTIFPKALFEKWETPPNDFSLDLYSYIFAKENKFTVQRFPVIFHKRSFGKSSWNNGLISRIKFVMRTLKYSQKLKRSL
jgi:glycosyltransferase involved in cell wall biosynthesis